MQRAHLNIPKRSFVVQNEFLEPPRRGFEAGVLSPSQQDLHSPADSVPNFRHSSSHRIAHIESRQTPNLASSPHAAPSPSTFSGSTDRLPPPTLFAPPLAQPTVPSRCEEQIPTCRTELQLHMNSPLNTHNSPCGVLTSVDSPRPCPTRTRRERGRKGSEEG